MTVTAADKFAELEDRIIRTIELVKTTRKQKDAAERELTFAHKPITRLEEEIEGRERIGQEEVRNLAGECERNSRGTDCLSLSSREPSTSRSTIKSTRSC